VREINRCHRIAYHLHSAALTLDSVLADAESDGEDELEDSPQPLSENSDVMAGDLLEATATSRYSCWIMLRF
jgi:hypothetical protein